MQKAASSYVVFLSRSEYSSGAKRASQSSQGSVVQSAPPRGRAAALLPYSVPEIGHNTRRRAPAGPRRGWRPGRGSRASGRGVSRRVGGGQVGRRLLKCRTPRAAAERKCRYLHPVHGSVLLRTRGSSRRLPSASACLSISAVSGSSGMAAKASTVPAGTLPLRQAEQRTAAMPRPTACHIQFRAPGPWPMRGLRVLSLCRTILSFRVIIPHLPSHLTRRKSRPCCYSSDKILPPSCPAQLIIEYNIILYRYVYTDV